MKDKINIELKDLTVGFKWKYETTFYRQPKITEYKIIGGYYEDITSDPKHEETTGMNLLKEENFVLQVYVTVDEHFGSGKNEDGSRQLNISHYALSIKPQYLLSVFNNDMKLLPEHRLYKF